MKKGLPNFLTILRIVLIPVLIISFYMERWVGSWPAALIFIFASITDYFDGLLARSLNAQSNFGRILDPISDKLLVASTLMMLVHFDRAPVIPAILILCREITVSGLREYLAEFRVSIPVTHLAKVKTAIQFIAILILLLNNNIIRGEFFYFLGQASIWTAAILTLVTGYAYCKEGFKKVID
jgi:CDP-diacylglycerol--glycerol-3-phosphate 3-phosphatidyltransferase (EC 2.7.8.5)